MNCLEFRRKLLENPQDNSEEFQAHLSECQTCAQEYRRAQAFETILKDAMQVKAPDDMTDRVLLNHQFREKSNHTRWYALAASIVLVVATMMFIQLPEKNSALAQTALHHIQDELPHLHDMNNVSDKELSLLLAYQGGDLQQSIGQVNYAGRCQIRKHSGIHMVLAGEKGAVTVLLMPHEYSDATAISHKRFQGNIIPTSFGSMAVIGEKGEDTKNIGEKLQHAISWRA